MTAVAVALLIGCSSPQPSASALRKDDLKGLAEVKLEHGPPTSAEVAARIDGSPVMWDDLAPLLAEASGATILRDVVLDRAVGAECNRRAVRIDAGAIEAERERLLESIERDAAAPGPDSGVLLESVRKSRGLGELRFMRLLERNARLRALVRDSIDVSASDVEQAMRVRYGERYRVRVVVVATEREAAEVKRDLERHSNNIDVAFPRAAALQSTDASAVRGGLLEPISPADQTYPAAIRALLPALAPGQISPVVAVDKGFAIMMLDSKLEATTPPDGASEGIRTEVRTRKERLAMEDEARRLLARAVVVPLDPRLLWSWRASTLP